MVNVSADNRTPIGAIIAFVAIVAAAMTALAFFPAPSPTSAQPLATLIAMGSPAVAAIIVFLPARRTFRGFRWHRPAPRYLLLGYALPALYASLPFILLTLVGLGKFTTQFWASYPAHLGLPADPWLGLLLLATVELLFSLITAAGEEVGWRGFLLPALVQRMRFWPAVTVTWAIWLAYHLPAMLTSAYHGRGTPLWFSVLCFALMLYGANLILAWLRLRSGSIWPCVVAHAAHNLFIQEICPSAFEGRSTSLWLVGEFGILTVISTGILAGIILSVWQVSDAATAFRISAQRSE